MKGFENLEKRLVARGGQFLAGNKLSWADLKLFDLVINVYFTFLNPSITGQFLEKNKEGKQSSMYFFAFLVNFI